MTCVFWFEKCSRAQSHKDSFLYLLPNSYHLALHIEVFSLSTNCFYDLTIMVKSLLGSPTCFLGVQTIVPALMLRCPTSPEWWLTGTSPMTPGASVRHLSLHSFFDLMSRPFSYNLFCCGVCMSMPHTPTPSDRNELCSFSLLCPRSSPSHSWIPGSL